MNKRFAGTWAKLRRWLIAVFGAAVGIVIGVSYIGETPEDDWQFQRTIVRERTYSAKDRHGKDSIFSKPDTIQDTVTIRRSLLAQMLTAFEFKYLDSLRKADPAAFNAGIASIFEAYMKHKTVFAQAKGVFTARTFLGTDTLVVDTPTAEVSISWYGNEWHVKPRWNRIKGDTFHYTGIYDLRYESNWICKGALDESGAVADSHPVYFMAGGRYKAGIVRGTYLDPTYGPTAILRSVGKGTAVESNHGGTIQLTVNTSASTAKFSSGLCDSVGVGDCIVYGDTLCFIHRRVTADSFVVKTPEGNVPAATSNNAGWSIYRAYTSLSNAESGTENTNIGHDFLGGNLNLTSLNKNWNIACYKDVVDMNLVVISGWTTDSACYLRIFTPKGLEEVGVSQRHNGTAGTGYRLEVTTPDWTGAINLQQPHVLLEGLSVKGTGEYAKGIFADNWNVEGVKIRECLIHHCSREAIQLVNSGVSGLPVTIRNCLIYGNSHIGIFLSGTFSYADIFNVTAVNNLNGGIYSDYYVTGGRINLINCYSQSDYGADYWDWSGAGFNTFEKCASADSTGTPGLWGVAASMDSGAKFMDMTPGTEDLHLRPGSVLIDAGSNLLAYFDNDMDGDSRTGVWDIGADEIACSPFSRIAFGDTILVDTFCYGGETTAGEPDTGIIETFVLRHVKADTVFTDSIRRAEIRTCSLQVDSNQIRRVRDSIVLQIDTCDGASDTTVLDTLGSDTVILAGDTLVDSEEFCSAFEADSTVFAVDTAIMERPAKNRYFMIPYSNKRYLADELGR